MKKLIAVIYLSAFYYLSVAQNKLLTMEDAMVKNRTTLSAENLKQLQFMYGTNEYVYLKKSGNADSWVKGNFKTKLEQNFLTLASLNEQMKAVQMDTFATMPTIQFGKSADWLISMKGTKISYNPTSKKAVSIVDKNIAGKTNVEESNAALVAYLDNNNLFVKNGTENKQITTDGSVDIVYASSVHQNEFGIIKGTFWGNNGRQLAYYRMDQSMIPNYPIIDWTVRPAKVNNVKYPMAGDKSHHVTVWVYNSGNGKNIQLQTGEPAEQYLTNIAWSTDDKFVFIAVLNREQNHMKLNQYDAETGAFVKTMFEEKDSKYVEPLVPMLFLKNNPNLFIWQSNSSGFNHLYLYNTDGDLLKKLTNGNWEVQDVKGFDDKGENLFYVSNQTSPLVKDLYKLNLKTAKATRITNGTGIHSVQVSNDGKYVLDNQSDAVNARIVRMIETATGNENLLLQAKNPLGDYALGKMEIFTIRGNDGEPLYARLFKPVGFDSTKKYPVVLYWYGGPHSQLINAGFNGGAGDYWFQYMAERGYLVFSMDVHGSDNRGKAFEQTIFRHAGEAQMADMMLGINYLNGLPYADKNNMGLFGWSYGGFMTIDFMLTHPGIFKAAVAGGPVIDWRYYETMYGERYMDTPQENPDGYAATDLTTKVDKLKGKLLIIHGLQDPVVVQQHSVRFVRAAIDKNIQVDYMIYPGHEHNVLGKDREHLYQKVTDYFGEWLR